MRMFVFSIIIKCFGTTVLKHEKRLCAQYIYNILLILSIICIFPLEVLWRFLLSNDVIVLPYQLFYVAKTIYTCLYMVFDSVQIPLILCIVWMLGILLQSLKEIYRYKRFKQYLKHWLVDVDVQNLKKIVSEYRHEFNLKKSVEIKVCEGIDSPFILGIKQIVLVIPFKMLETEGLPYIIRHEIIHVKRKDNIFKLFIRILRILNWYNFFFKKIENYISLYCEVSCDQIVVQNQGKEYRKIYGGLLLNTVVQHSPKDEQLNISFVDNKTFITKRIDGIIGNKTQKTKGLRFILYISFFIAYFSLLQITDLNQKVLQAYVISDFHPSSKESIAKFSDVILRLTYEEYADYDITYNENNEQLYYNNKLVKELTDQDMKVYYFSNTGKCYINIKRDAKGNIERAIIDNSPK